MAEKSILLVEDNPLDARFIIKSIESGDLQNSIATVRDGEEALSYIRKQGIYRDVSTPGLILLDLKMPKKSGIELLEDLKKEGVLEKTAVIVITTSDSEMDLKKCRELGVKKFITKPLDMNEFINEIRSIEPVLRQITTGIQ